jgi:hypothetical protein
MTTSLVARRHLLHLEKNKEMTTSQGNSPSFATPKKNKEMTTSRGNSPSSVTPEKKTKR